MMLLLILSCLVGTTVLVYPPGEVGSSLPGEERARVRSRVGSWGLKGRSRGEMNEVTAKSTK
jgi:hypothetical protein